MRYTFYLFAYLLWTLWIIVICMTSIDEIF